MTHGSLFSGIGGAELAAEWMGWENLFHCEINEFCRTILEYHYPNSISYENIITTDFTQWRGKINVLTGGFPCQPMSCAGKRKGAEDDRYLWPQMLRAISEIRPDWVVAENVAGILSMVQPPCEVNVENENSLFPEDNDIVEEQSQYIIETICQDLEKIGYTVQPIVIPACAVGAPHRRDRVWFIASNTNIERRPSASQWQQRESRLYDAQPKSVLYTREDVTNPDCQRDRTPTTSGCSERNRSGNNGITQERSITPEWDSGLSKVQRNVADTMCRGCGPDECDGRGGPVRGDQEWQHTQGQSQGFGLRSTSGENDKYVANAKSRRLQGRIADGYTNRDNEEGIWQGIRGAVEGLGDQRTTADTTCQQGERCESGEQRESCQPQQEQPRRSGGKDSPTPPCRRQHDPNYWASFPTQSPVCRRDDGVSPQLDSISFSKWRIEAIKAYGNAWVPQVAYEIFKAIEIVEQTKNKQ